MIREVHEMYTHLPLPLWILLALVSLVVGVWIILRSVTAVLDAFHAYVEASTTGTGGVPADKTHFRLSIVRNIVRFALGMIFIMLGVSSVFSS